MYRTSSLVLGCILISLSSAASAGALSAVSGLASGVGKTLSTTVVTATSTVTGLAGTATGVVGQAAAAASSTVSQAAGAVTGTTSSVTSGLAATTATAAASEGGVVGSPIVTLPNAVLAGKKSFKFHKVHLLIKKKRVVVVRRDEPMKQDGRVPITSTKLDVNACERFLDQFKLLQSFSIDSLYKNCPEIAPKNGARTAGQ